MIFKTGDRIFKTGDRVFNLWKTEQGTVVKQLNSKITLVLWDTRYTATTALSSAITLIKKPISDDNKEELAMIDSLLEYYKCQT